MKVMCVAGARPNFPKLKPVLDALHERSVETVFVHTGQHYDERMSDVFLSDLGIRAPDEHLEVGSGSHARQTAEIMTRFEPVMQRHVPDVVVVVGDVNSTVACALVAAKLGALVAHVEAGLRSRDWSMPEEINRVVTDRLSDFLLAPSPDAVDNLRSEGYRPDQIHLVGNVMIDTLRANVDRAADRLDDVKADCGVAGERFALTTLHRPSNVDDPVVLAGLARALAEVGEQLPVVFPVHPRTRARLADSGIALSNVELVEPLGYLDFLALEAAAALVLTDSGGIQEETTAMGVPCLTLRDNTERPITVSEGTNQVVGTDPARIVAAASTVLVDGIEVKRPALWDGHAGLRIAEVIATGGTAATRPRPTDR